MANCNPNDCLSFPFPPECFEFCIEQILRVATPEDKSRILGMAKDLSQAIYQAYNYGTRPIRSFSDLKQVLSDDQIINIKLIFSNLTQEQLDYFIRKLK